MAGAPNQLPPFGTPSAPHITLNAVGGSDVSVQAPSARVFARASAPYVAATPSAGVGVANTVYWTTVAPEPHDQAHSQPLEAVEAFTMTGTIAVYAPYAAAVRLRRSFIPRLS